MHDRYNIKKQANYSLYFAIWLYMNGENMYLIVGLGNPGENYTLTRHNAGFLAVSKISEKYNIPLSFTGYHAIYGIGKVHGKEVMLAQPQTFMNDSGISVKALMNHFHIPLKNLVVIYDDMDIELGQVRIRERGSAGTHNGMRSIVNEHLKTQDFPRIRIGIGKPDPNRENIIQYVLGKFRKDELPIFIDTLDKVIESVEVIVTKGIDIAMNHYNQKKSSYNEIREQLLNEMGIKVPKNDK